MSTKTDTKTSTDARAFQMGLLAAVWLFYVVTMAAMDSMGREITSVTFWGGYALVSILLLVRFASTSRK